MQIWKKYAFLLGIPPADGLAPLSVRSYAGTVKFVSPIHKTDMLNLVLFEVFLVQCTVCNQFKHYYLSVLAC